MARKKLFSLRKRELIGVDIGSTAVKAVSLSTDEGEHTVTAAAMMHIPASNGHENIRVQNTTNALKACLGAMGVKTRAAVCGVSGPEVAVRDFRFPVLPPDELETAVMLEAKQVCPFNTDRGTVDYQILSEKNNQTAGVLVAATNRLVVDRVSIARNSSLDCVLMDVDGLALLNCYKQSEQKDDDPVTAILNIGASCTTLAIADADDMPFIRDISNGADEIIETMANITELTPDEIRQYLCDPQQEPPFDIQRIVERASKKLMTDISRTLRYYAAREEAEPIARMLACGGFVLVPGFVQMLNDSLPAEVIPWNPLEKMQVRANDHTRRTIEQMGPAMAVAAGLAMRSI